MHVDGLVIAGEPSEAMLAGLPVPIAVAGWRDGIPEGADLAADDDDAGGGIAAGHLLGLGHTGIGHLSGSGAAAHRRAGFQAGLRKKVWNCGLPGKPAERPRRTDTPPTLGCARPS